MQVFVNRSDLTLSVNEIVRVLGYYDDGVEVAATAHGPQAALLSLSKAAIDNTRHGTVLTSGWREANRELIVYSEAERRILAAFPDYSQRNASAELMGYLAVHGAAAAWPAAAQRRKAEIDRAWAYVEAVRRAARGILARALPANPVADSHWPARISPYQSA
jgi:hypothetical protein